MITIYCTRANEIKQWPKAECARFATLLPMSKNTMLKVKSLGFVENMKEITRLFFGLCNSQLQFVQRFTLFNGIK